MFKKPMNGSFENKGTEKETIEFSLLDKHVIPESLMMVKHVGKCYLSGEVSLTVLTVEAQQ